MIKSKNEIEIVEMRRKHTLFSVIWELPIAVFYCLELRSIKYY